MVQIITNSEGELEVDPQCRQRHFSEWKRSLMSQTGDINYTTFKELSSKHSELLTKYLLDLEIGRNIAKRTNKGARSFNHLVNTKYRLMSCLKILEKHTGKTNMDFTEDDVLHVFDEMRRGLLYTSKGKPFQAAGNYAKIFASFWRWFIRTQRKEGITIPDICADLRTSRDEKPKWVYFTLSQVDQMAKLVPYEHATLMYFLFDCGVRAPKEMMNIRVKDLSKTPNSEILLLTVRDETSKTFGRKIKLMLSSQKITEYIKATNLQPNDFLFSKEPTTYNRSFSRAGFKVLGIGKPNITYLKGKPNKTTYFYGVTMYDFRHNSVCHYLPIYKSENQMMYRYGWKQSSMIHYYSEYLGMKDTIKDEDMLIDTTKTQLEQELQKERLVIEQLKEQLEAQKRETDLRIARVEQMLVQKFVRE